MRSMDVLTQVHEHNKRRYVIPRDTPREIENLSVLLYSRYSFTFPQLSAEQLSLPQNTDRTNKLTRTCYSRSHRIICCSSL